ncbi:MAG: T9SS type A sorting domain-containing protein [Bacteroidales bacterium]|nr:T9SS type A sorting domain-containing protein [Bacteroidales bacterium]
MIAMAVFGVAAAYAQQQYQPVPFPTGRAYWCERYDSVGNRNGMLDYFHIRNTFFLNGEDTIISGIFHKKLFFSYNGDTANAIFYGGLYEDSLRRVWYSGEIPPHGEDVHVISSNNYSCMLYDFSLKVGDTIDREIMTNTDAQVVSLIDTIDIGGVLRKRIHFENMDFTWIEGIGSSFGLLYYNGETPTCDMCPNNVLLCNIQNGTLVYHLNNLENSECFSTNATISPESAPRIAAYPNPANERVTLEFGEAQFHTLRLVNAAGYTVLQLSLTGHEPQLTLQLKGMPKGIYSCILSGKDGTATQKIVVE